TRRTAEQIRLVRKWAETSPPTLWNEMLTARIARDRPAPLEAARAYVYLNTAMHDAFVSCWATKYRYLVARPFQRQPSLRTVIKTPNFPSYTSGHATISGAASEVLSALYPAEAGFFRQQADEAADSRLWGGIHFRHDNEVGLEVGRKIGRKVAGLMRGRGAP
ncbi:MAG TPA: vanadium-dependent haloperoxidase, partial [Myxococcales bacterium]|nr:vanadium-dependent haloperoxidase [Myxococcales bacterium]